MSKTKAPRKTASPAKGKKAPSRKQIAAAKARNDFMVAALNMSWQLAVVVLVPVIGGVKLDEALGTLPALTFVGFIIAVAGMVAVVWRQFQLLSPPPSPKRKRA